MTNEATRAVHLLQNTRCAAISCIHEGEPWCATINYVLTADMKILFYSSPHSTHSRSIKVDPHIAGAIYTVEDGEIDGAQFTGICVEVNQKSLIDELHPYYYRTNFPDPAVRDEWMIPVSSFYDGGLHRFYTIELQYLWVIDIDRWEENKVDQRLKVDLSAIRRAWTTYSSRQAS